MNAMWNILHTVGANTFALGLVIVLHEAGHFFMCRRLGVRVEKFAFGFGPELLGFTDRLGTRVFRCARSRSEASSSRPARIPPSRTRLRPRATSTSASHGTDACSSCTPARR